MIYMSDDKQKLLLCLNEILSNYFVLYVKFHRYKWFLFGEHAILYESFFERTILAWHERIETIASHILSLDGKPFATMQKYVKKATIIEASADDEEEEVFHQLYTDMTTLCEEIEEKALQLAKNIEDERTIQLLCTLLNDLYRYRWRFTTYDE